MKHEAILAYHQSNTNHNPLQLVHDNLDLIKSVAYHLKGRLPESVLIEDLIQSGAIGLIMASEQYDVSQGTSFATYAGIRIKGAMLDGLRQDSWAPRSVAQNNRLIGAAIDNLEQSLQRNPSDQEVAQKLNITLSQYHAMLTDASSAQLLSADDLTEGQIDNFVNNGILGDPENITLQDELQSRIAQAIAELPEREKLVISLYYDEELNFREIGEVIGVKESRAHQIMGAAIIKIRQKIAVN